MKKIGQIVDPACTAKLYRPLMPANDFNTYWPLNAPSPVSTARLYPGIDVARDQSFGPNAKDVVDVFSAERKGSNRPVFIYVAGGGGNKIEQQVREGNAFYDNIGRWAVKNGMVGVTVQRHPGSGNWDDGGRDLSMAVDWVKANAAKFGGNAEPHLHRRALGRHRAARRLRRASRTLEERRAGEGRDLHVGQSGARASAAGRAGAGRGGPGGAPAGPTPGAACGVGANMGSNDGRIAGRAGRREAAGIRRGGRGRGAFQPPSADELKERDNLPGFKATPVKVMLVRAELDPGVMGDMTAADKALHDEMCKVDRCPAMLFAKDHSHMSEVFSFDTPDTTVSAPILAWLKAIK